MPLIQVITLLIILILLIIIASYMIHSFLFSVPFYPARSSEFEGVLKKLKLDVKNKKFIDIGSGDGRIVIKAAKLGMRADGVEINPFLSLWSKLKIKLFRLKNSQIYNQSWMDVDYSKYDIVYMYIYNEHMDTLKEKLFGELKKGSIILSNTFSFTEVEESQKIGRYRIYKV